jgi:hypothetical protein
MPAEIDFYRGLSGIGDTIAASRKDAARRKAFEDINSPDGTVDFNKAILGLTKAGDIEGAARISAIKNQMDDRARQTQRDAIGDARWAQEFSLKKKQQAVDGVGKTGLNPFYGVDAEGNPVVMQPNTSGKAVQTQLPQGVRLSREPIKLDAGSHFVLLDPVTRQQVGMIPKDLAGAASETAQGKATGEAIATLPGIMKTAGETLKSIEHVRSHPGRPWATGALGTLPGVPGTAQRGFISAHKQLQGKTFLAAFDALRGGGAITEAEGAKATDALARLDRAQNDADFDSALDDLRDVIKAGMFVASTKARGRGGAPAPAAVTQPTRLRFNPAKNDFE